VNTAQTVTELGDNFVDRVAQAFGSFETNHSEVVDFFLDLNGALTSVGEVSWQLVDSPTKVSAPIAGSRT
jgi:hypothetical protein